MHRHFYLIIAAVVSIISVLLIGCAMPGTPAATTNTAEPVIATASFSEESAIAVEAESNNGANATDPILVPTATPAFLQVTEQPQEPAAEAVDWLTQASKEGDLYVLGNANAPIRLIDYSDFL
ncbi:MAG: hypothetical protein R2932_32665 [Caldilineaceae bacterium]